MSDCVVVEMAPQYEMAVGLKKGHRVTRLQNQARPSRRRGVSATYLTSSQSEEEVCIIVILRTLKSMGFRNTRLLCCSVPGQ